VDLADDSGEGVVGIPPEDDQPAPQRSWIDWSLYDDAFG
jgi:hypothetical protein